MGDIRDIKSSQKETRRRTYYSMKSRRTLAKRQKQRA